MGLYGQHVKFEHNNDVLEGILIDTIEHKDYGIVGIIACVPKIYYRQLSDIRITSNLVCERCNNGCTN